MNTSSIRRIIENILKASLFIIPFIPLYISQSLFFPYITGKAFVFRAIVEVAFALWIWLALFHKEYRPKKTALLYAVSAWLVAVVIATIFGVNPVKSFWSNFERMEGLVMYLHLWAFFMVIGSVFKKQDWKWFFQLFLISGLFENIYVFLQWSGYLASIQGGATRTDGTIGNPAYLAAYLIFTLAFSVLLWLQSKDRIAKYFYGFMAVFTLASIYFTASRGPSLGLLAGGVLAGVLYIFLSPSEDRAAVVRKKAAAAILALLIIVPSGLWLMRDSDFIRNSPRLSRLTSLSFSDRTISSRFTIWSMSFEGFKEHPILGWGPENYVVVFSKYFKAELWQQEPWFDRSHDIIFDWLINAGAVGLLSYLSMFAAVGYMLWKNFRNGFSSLEESVLIVAILFAYFFQNLFVFDNIATYIGFFALLGYEHAVFTNGSSVPEKPRKDSYLSADQEALAIGAMGGLLIVFGGILYFINVRPLLTNISLLNALEIQGSDPVGALADYQQALSYDFLGKQEIREQLTRFAITAGGSPALSADFKDKLIRLALTEDQSSVLENPQDPRSYIMAGGLLSRVGMQDQALQIFGRAIELSPNKQQIYFEVADVYFQKGDYKNAVAVLEKSYALDPSFNQAQINLAAAYILSGAQDKADQILIKGYGTADVPDTILAQVYANTKNYPRLIATWAAFVKVSPVNLDYRKSLAGAYLSAGDTANATRVIVSAMNAFPEFQQQGAQLIAQIKAGK